MRSLNKTQLEAKKRRLSNREEKNREVLRQNNGDPKELQNILESMSFLINYRNNLVHGERFDEEDHIGANCLGRSLLCSRIIWEYRCVVQYEETTWNLSNSTPIQIEFLDTIQSKEIILMSPDNKPLVSLSPLLCVRQDIDITAEGIDEVFFINIGVLEREQLEYVGFQYAQHQHGKQLGTYEQFKNYLACIPLPSQRR